MKRVVWEDGVDCTFRLFIDHSNLLILSSIADVAAMF